MREMVVGVACVHVEGLLQRAANWVGVDVSAVAPGVSAVAPGVWRERAEGGVDTVNALC